MSSNDLLVYAQPEFVHEHMKSIEFDWRSTPGKVGLDLIHKGGILKDKSVCNSRFVSFQGEYIISHISEKHFPDLAFSSYEY